MAPATLPAGDCREGRGFGRTAGPDSVLPRCAAARAPPPTHWLLGGAAGRRLGVGGLVFWVVWPSGVRDRPRDGRCGKDRSEVRSLTLQNSPAKRRLSPPLRRKSFFCFSSFFCDAKRSPAVGGRYCFSREGCLPPPLPSAGLPGEAAPPRGMSACSRAFAGQPGVGPGCVGSATGWWVSARFDWGWKRLNSI